MSTKLALLIFASVFSLVGSTLGAWWFLIAPSRYKTRDTTKVRGTNKVVLLTTFFLTGTLTLIAAFSGDFDLTAQPPLRYEGRVLNTAGKPVQTAKVIVDDPRVQAQVTYTDSSGVFAVTLPNLGLPIVRMRVEASGYEAYEKNINLSRTGIETIFLTESTPRPIPLTSRCPTISLSCPDVVDRGRTIELKASVPTGSDGATPTYNWVVSSGTIINGQGTPSITVDTTGLGGQTVIATLEIGGFDPSCARTASCATTVR